MDCSSFIMHYYNCTSLHCKFMMKDEDVLKYKQIGHYTLLSLIKPCLFFYISFLYMYSMWIILIKFVTVVCISYIKEIQFLFQIRK